MFIDVEILRPAVRSIGNHLFALDDDDVSHLRTAYPMCASPNLWRGINVADSFQRKYPFGTLPLLLASHAVRDESFSAGMFWIALALHTDSAFSNAAHYQANALDWLAAMNTAGHSPGLDRMCSRMKRMPGQVMLSLLDRVQNWASEAGFGGRQRPCRFDPRATEDNDKIARLVGRLSDESGHPVTLPFGNAVTCSEEFEIERLPNHTVGRRCEAFARARAARALSMAATGRSADGLSLTLPNSSSPIPVLR